MIGGYINIRDETEDGVRKTLGGILHDDGFLMIDRIEDSKDGRVFKERLSLNPQETEEFYKQLKQLMEVKRWKND